MRSQKQEVISREIEIPLDSITLSGELSAPAEAAGLVLFAHGSGSSGHSQRNRQVARMINDAGIGTLLFDLLTPKEEAIDLQTRHLRFDLPLLQRRLVAATACVSREPGVSHLPIGYFGSSTGGGAALMAAAKLGDRIGAVVSRGGRPDMAGASLPRVSAPTLLIVGSLDDEVLRLNEEALSRLCCVKELKIVPGATHLFEEPGMLEIVARLAADWFRRYLTTGSEENAEDAE